MTDMLYYILCAVLTVGILIGISMMSKVKSSVAGNMLSAVCTLAAILVTLFKYDILSDWMLWVALAIGSVAGLFAAARVKMIQMPQAVAILNGFGGAASALVAIASLMNASMDTFSRTTAGLALAVGMLTLTGSLVAAAKLHGLMSQKPIVLRGHQGTVIALLIVTLVCVVLMIPFADGSVLTILGIVCFVASSLFGWLFAIRVGGADMPITISLLNSFSGVAGAIAGMAISDPLLVAVGGVVGASGLLLTRVMCKAMNRSLSGILLNKAAAPAKTEAAVQPEPTRPEPVQEAPAQTESTLAEPAADPAVLAAGYLHSANSVIIVPGYGMAVAQAQSLVKQLSDRLEADGKDVAFAIHPVAGRMPGHMNVLLAEVDVPYEKLLELDEVNPKFDGCDAAVIIGANDVVNPAANTAEGTPIYGMPILNADQAQHIIICNFDLKPGYAGVENPLYGMDRTTMLLGDAKETVAAVIAELYKG